MKKIVSFKQWRCGQAQLLQVGMGNEGKERSALMAEYRGRLYVHTSKIMSLPQM
jgi:hypothetical protein